MQVALIIGERSGGLTVPEIPEVPLHVFVVADKMAHEGVLVQLHHDPRAQVDADLVLVPVDFLQPEAGEFLQRFVALFQKRVDVFRALQADPALLFFFCSA